MCTIFFFFNDTATTEIYTLSLHDALPISNIESQLAQETANGRALSEANQILVDHANSADKRIDRKSTRLNSSHSQISYAVFCLKKKKKKNKECHVHNMGTDGVPVRITPHE